MKTKMFLIVLVLISINVVAQYSFTTIGDLMVVKNQTLNHGLYLNTENGITKVSSLQLNVWMFGLVTDGYASLYGGPQIMAKYGSFGVAAGGDIKGNARYSDLLILNYKQWNTVVFQEYGTSGYWHRIQLSRETIAGIRLGIISHYSHGEGPILRYTWKKFLVEGAWYPGMNHGDIRIQIVL